jgi:hypothetical protein
MACFTRCLSPLVYRGAILAESPSNVACMQHCNMDAMMSRGNRIWAHEFTLLSSESESDKHRASSYALLISKPFPSPVSRLCQGHFLIIIVFST